MTEELKKEIERIFAEKGLQITFLETAKTDEEIKQELNELFGAKKCTDNKRRKKQDV